MSRALADSAVAMSDDEESIGVAPITASAAATSSDAAAAAVPKKKKKKGKKKKAGGVGSAGADDAMDADKSAQELEAEEWLAGLTEEDVLNPKLQDATFLAQLRSTFHAGQPFKYLQIEHLLDPAFLRTLENELKGLDYYQKSNDLFEFAQSSDLKSVDTPLVTKLKSILYGKKFRSILTGITDIELGELESTVSMSANVYGDTNTLLCHDDELHGRRIAYILYLVPPSWTAEDGGSLDLFDTDEHAQPRNVVKSLVPSQGTFTFFEVSPVSFHQVSEILTSEEDPDSGENKVRISISGWFHGAPIHRPEQYVEPAMVCKPLVSDTTFTLDEWLSPDYRKSKNIAKISSSFQDESSIELPNFLAKDKYERLMKALNEAPQEEWQQQGPANKRKFERFARLTEVKSLAAIGAGAAASSAAASSSAAPSSSSAAFLSALNTFLQSTVFGAFLEEITGMTYVSSHGTVRKFTPGCYTLAHSDDNERFEEAVDISLCCLKAVPAGIAGKKVPRWDTEALGGSTHYIEEGAEEELMSLEPRENTLSIVYRCGLPEEEREEARQAGTGGVIKFLKYTNHRATQPKFDFDFTFRVQPDEDDEEGSDISEEEEEVVQKPASKGGKKGGK